MFRVKIKWQHHKKGTSNWRKMWRKSNSRHVQGLHPICVFFAKRQSFGGRWLKLEWIVDRSQQGKKKPVVRRLELYKVVRKVSGMDSRIKTFPWENFLCALFYVWTYWVIQRIHHTWPHVTFTIPTNSLASEQKTSSERGQGWRTKKVPASKVNNSKPWQSVLSDR